MMIVESYDTFSDPCKNVKTYLHAKYTKMVIGPLIEIQTNNALKRR